MDPTIRRIRILQMIPRQGEGSITATRILEKLNQEGNFGQVTKRTVERDLVTLSEHFGIDHEDEETPYQWCWYNKDVVDIPAMGRDTALAFLLARDYLKPLLPRAALASLSHHFRRAEETLKDGKTSAAQWKRRVRVVPRYFHPIAASVSKPILEAVDRALYEQRKLRVKYQSLERIRNGEPPRWHRLNPVMLAYRNSYTELLAYTDRRQGLNRFVLHRILKAEVLDEGIDRNPHPGTLEEEIATRMAWPENGQLIQLKAWVETCDAYHVMDTPLSNDQQLEHVEDGVIVTARLRLTSSLIWWILGMGARIEILEPSELRDKIKGIIGEMAKRYR